MRASEFASDCKGVNLTPGDRESVPDRDFNVFVPRVVKMRLVDDDISCGGSVSQIWIWNPVPWRCLWLGAITDTRHPVMR
jgi:hypothetical protein